MKDICFHNCQSHLVWFTQHFSQYNQGSIIFVIPSKAPHIYMIGTHRMKALQSRFEIEASRMVIEIANHTRLPSKGW